MLPPSSPGHDIEPLRRWNSAAISAPRSRRPSAHRTSKTTCDLRSSPILSAAARQLTSGLRPPVPLRLRNQWSETSPAARAYAVARRPPRRRAASSTRAFLGSHPIPHWPCKSTRVCTDEEEAGKDFPTPTPGCEAALGLIGYRTNSPTGRSANDAIATRFAPGLRAPDGRLARELCVWAGG